MSRHTYAGPKFGNHCDKTTWPEICSFANFDQGELLGMHTVANSSTWRTCSGSGKHWNPSLCKYSGGNKYWTHHRVSLFPLDLLQMTYVLYFVILMSHKSAKIVTRFELLDLLFLFFCFEKLWTQEFSTWQQRYAKYFLEKQNKICHLSAQYWKLFPLCFTLGKQYLCVENIFKLKCKDTVWSGLNTSQSHSIFSPPLEAIKFHQQAVTIY